MMGKLLSHVIVRMPSGVVVESTTTPLMLTVLTTVYMYGLPNSLLFGYQRCGDGTVIVWSNVGGGLAFSGAILSGVTGNGFDGRLVGIDCTEVPGTSWPSWS